MLLRTFLYLTAGLVLQCASAQAQNLIQNPDFTTGIANWTDTFPVYTGTVCGANPTFSWDNTTGDPAPGSAYLAESSPASGACAVSACITISAPQRIDLSANVEVDAGVAQIYLVTFTDASCTSYLSPFVLPFTALPPPAWRQYYFAANSQLIVPTKSVEVVLSVFGSAGVAGSAHFDHIFFAPSATTPVRLQSFDVK